MNIIIPEDHEDLLYLKEMLAKSYPHVRIVLSPFMYMNYEDALRMTYEMLTIWNSSCFILDLTGITIDIYYMLLGVSYVDNNAIKIDKHHLYVSCHQKKNKKFVNEKMHSINMVFDK